MNTIHPEPEDDRIVLNEDSHRYYFKSYDNNELVEVDFSVTQLKSIYQNKFDPEKSVNNIVNSSVYRRKTYKYYSMSRDEILELWNRNREETRMKGIEVHKQIEDYYNDSCRLGLSLNKNMNLNSNLDSNKNLNTNIDLATNLCSNNKIENIEFSNFLNFHNSLPDNIIPYRTEFPVSNMMRSDFYDLNEVSVAGMIDMIYRIDDSSSSSSKSKYIICDWKVSSIDKRHYGKYMYSPLDHIRDSKYNRFCIQLNLYKYLFESTDRNRKVEEMWLVNLKGSDYNVYKVKLMDIKSILDESLYE